MKSNHHSIKNDISVDEDETIIFLHLRDFLIPTARNSSQSHNDIDEVSMERQGHNRIEAQCNNTNSAFYYSSSENDEP
jgi:hypothetical protein